MSSQRYKEAAKEAANYIREKAGSFLTVMGGMAVPTLDTAVVLGTGWDKVLMSKAVSTIEISFTDIPGFEYLKEIQGIKGHSKKVVIAKLDHSSLKRIIMLRGRVHVNEAFDTVKIYEMVRLQMEMLMELGVKNFVLTNAAGGLRPRGLNAFFRPKVRVGDIVAHNSFITVFAPRRPLVAGEFCSPEEMLREKNIVKIEEAAKKAELKCYRGAGAMMCGPDFETLKHDKGILSNSGAMMAMMSILPEVAVLALDPKLRVFAMSCICNDDIAKHSHNKNLKTMDDFAPQLGTLLLTLIGSL